MVLLDGFAPPPNTIKINVDAAISDQRSTLSVVVRNEKGELLKAWAKHTDGGDTLEANTHAVLWALELALLEGFQDIIIEGDAKLCLDAIGDKSVSSWTIGSLIDNIGERSNFFMSFSFCWVKRDANYVAHALAKFASSLSSISSPFCFDKSSIPQAVWDAWKLDVLTFPL